jgi:hypothetical protein
MDMPHARVLYWHSRSVACQPPETCATSDSLHSVSHDSASASLVVEVVWVQLIITLRNRTATSHCQMQPIFSKPSRLALAVPEQSLQLLQLPPVVSVHVE